MIHEYIWGSEDWIYQDGKLLVKRIKANDKLSVQVHPDNEYAKANGLASGKTESWYIEACKDGAFIYLGLAEGLADRFETAEELRGYLKSAVDDGSIEKDLKKYFVKPGEFYFVPAGSVHAIGAGIDILEIQQDCNVTFRLYDYKRKDANGNERELHVEQALECIKPEAPCGKKELPFECEYFKVKKRFGRLTWKSPDKQE